MIDRVALHQTIRGTIGIYFGRPNIFNLAPDFRLLSNFLKLPVSNLSDFDINKGIFGSNVRIHNNEACPSSSEALRAGIAIDLIKRMSFVPEIQSLLPKTELDLLGLTHNVYREIEKIGNQDMRFAPENIMDDIINIFSHGQQSGSQK